MYPLKDRLIKLINNKAIKNITSVIDISYKENKFIIKASQISAEQEKIFENSLTLFKRSYDAFAKYKSQIN